MSSIDKLFRPLTSKDNCVIFNIQSTIGLIGALIVLLIIIFGNKYLKLATHEKMLYIGILIPTYLYAYYKYKVMYSMCLGDIK